MVPNVAAREDPTEVDLDSESATTSATAAPAEAAVATPAADGPICTQQHVLNCQFGQWHPIFRHCTPRSVALELPQDVVRYLQQDGVVLPKGFGMSCGEGAQDDSDDEVDWGDESDEEDGDQRPDFPGLHKLLSDAIASLGGSVFPKLNWSCPKDATWVNRGTLKCSLPGEVLCLLKSSTFIAHDLNHAFDACADATISRPPTFTLVLRKWCNLHPSMLFRCFVRERRLVGVSQRDCTSYYEFLQEESDRLCATLEDFFAAEICKKFPDPDCVADVYIDNRSRVWLLDINPFSSVTDSLLFDWSEDALAAPLPAALSPREEETLPPGVFARVYFDPSPTLGGGGGEAATDASGSPSMPSPGQGGGGASQGGGARGHAPEAVHALGGGRERGFEFRCVPSNLHMVPDPMGRYRGPADVAMGTLMGGTGGDGGLDELIESCRLAGIEG